MRIYLFVLNDLAVDQRLHRVSVSLQKMGHQPHLIGIRKSYFQKAPVRSYPTRLVYALPKKGPLFFLWCNLRIFFLLLFLRRWDVAVANDLDTLAGTFLAAKIRGKKLVYDAHEFYTGSVFLVNKPIKRALWGYVEKLLFPRVRWCMTVSLPIACIYQERYRKPVWVIENRPFFASPSKPTFSKRLIYQGNLHPGRGLEAVIQSLRYVPDWELWIVGDGEMRSSLEKLVKECSVQDRVRFWGRVPFEQLAAYTRQAALGVAADKPVSQNYEYALPNKFFDYLQAGIPILTGPTLLVRAHVAAYQCGLIVLPWEPEPIAQALRSLGPREYATLVEGVMRAAQVFTWENQMSKLETFYTCVAEDENLPHFERCDEIK
ncbi:MAG: glycosyltransferase family 4 protein [Bacteroidia bacterium]